MKKTPFRLKINQKPAIRRTIHEQTTTSTKNPRKQPPFRQKSTKKSLDEQKHRRKINEKTTTSTNNQRNTTISTKHQRKTKFRQKIKEKWIQLSRLVLGTNMIPFKAHFFGEKKMDSIFHTSNTSLQKNPFFSKTQNKEKKLKKTNVITSRQKCAGCVLRTKLG